MQGWIGQDIHEFLYVSIAVDFSGEEEYFGQCVNPKRANPA
jgi:hypothetical protein